MAKQEVFDHRVTGPIMRSLRHIPVDRASGAASFEEACRQLKEGELVGVYPEATISRSFEIKEFKSGAARMAIAAGRADRPAHRVGCPAHLDQGPSQDDVAAQGADLRWRSASPIDPTLPAGELTALLHSRMQHLLERVQDAYGPIRLVSTGCPSGWAGGARRWPRPTRPRRRGSRAAGAAAKAARQAEGAGPE